MCDVLVAWQCDDVADELLDGRASGEEFYELCIHVLALLDDVVVIEQVLQYEVIALEDLIQAGRGAGAEASTKRRPERALQHGEGRQVENAPEAEVTLPESCQDTARLVTLG